MYYIVRIFIIHDANCYDSCYYGILPNMQIVNVVCYLIFKNSTQYSLCVDLVNYLKCTLFDYGHCTNCLMVCDCGILAIMHGV